MDAFNRKAEKLILATISIGFLIWSSIFIYQSSFIAIDGNRYFCLFDDAMISMRYATNLSHGLGLVWNAGERIEGYTNLLMTLLMSISTLIFDRSPAVLFIQILGVVFMLAIAFTTMKITDYFIVDQKNRSFFRVLAYVGALCYYPLSYWSLMGMETGLLALLLLLAIRSTFDYLDSHKFVSLLFVAMYLGLAFLTRNDSVILAVLIGSYIFWEMIGTNSDRKIVYQMGGAISLYFLFVIGQLGFQYLYYGEVLPNTYTLKLVGMSLADRIRNGLRFISSFLVEILVFLSLAIAEVILHFQKRKLLLLSIVLSTIGYQVYVGGDPWPYWRILSPEIPLLIVLFLDALNSFVADYVSRQAYTVYPLHRPILSRKYHHILLMMALILIGFLLANMRFLQEISFLTKPYSEEINRSNINTALAIEQLTTSDASVGVYWAGSIPYFTNRKAIDFLGKSDKFVSHLDPDMSGMVAWNGMTSVPGHNKYDLNYSIITLRPTYVQGFIWGTQDLSEWAKTQYVQVEYDGISLFLLKDSPAVLWENMNATD